MRLSLCRECYRVMDNGAWPLCDECTQKRVTEAVATPLDIPVLWDDVPELPKYGEDDVPTVPTGQPIPLAAMAPPKRVCAKCLVAHRGPCVSRQYPESISWYARKQKRVPTMEERAAWFHHTQTTVADQVGPKKPLLLTRLWLLICRLAARTEGALLRFL